MTELLTIIEAAKRMHVSRQTIYAWINKGKIKPLLTPGGRIRIPSDQLVIETQEPPKDKTSNLFPVRNISDLEPERSEQLGTKDKWWFWRTKNHWYWNFDGENFLFKAGREGTGDNWAEKIASELCHLLGLPHAEYDLAVFNNLRGVITPNFVPEGGARFEAGNEILALYIGEYEKTKRFHKTKHTIDNVLRAIKKSASPYTKGLPIEWAKLRSINSAMDVFIGYLMLDAWIANQDRHHENWGLIIIPEDKSVHLAPTFDHASSLGRNENDTDREDRLTTRDKNRSMDRYVQRARSAFYRTQSDTRPLSTLEAFTEAAMANRGAARTWLSRLKQISLSDTRAIIDRIPNKEISDIAKEFTQKIIELNRERLITITL